MSKLFNTYPIFEGDQVLTASHLNSLRTFLEKRNLETRSRLIGAGIVCGLHVLEKNTDSITLSSGIGITSRGHLLELAESDCRFIAAYRDKAIRDTGEKPAFEEPGIYKLFRGEEEGEQIPVWELLTTEEETKRADTNIHPLGIDSSDEIRIPDGDNEITVRLSDHLLVLYLEMDDEDLESCFGEDCDEKGIRRTFTVRKLLVPETAVAEQAEIHPVPESFLCIRRPEHGGTSAGQSRYALSGVNTWTELRQPYEAVITRASEQLEQALKTSFTRYGTILKPAISENPFANIFKNTTLTARIQSAFSGSVYNVQQRFDCLKHLVRAWNEFLKSADDAVVYCLPETHAWPRHLVAGPVEPGFDKLDRIPYRHEFIPASGQFESRRFVELARLKYRRVAEMIRQLGPVPASSAPIRVTPALSGSGRLSDRPIPFYFNLGAQSKLDHIWNPDDALHRRFRHNITWHSRNGQVNECFQNPSGHHAENHQFYRVEGHIGKTFTSALQTLEAEKERLNLPIKVIGLKLSRHPGNITFDTECRFDDLEQQYDLLVTGLSCLFDEEISFFTHLQVSRPKKEQPAEKPASEPSTPVFTGTIDVSKAYEPSYAPSSSINLFQSNKLTAEQSGDGAQFMMMKYSQVEQSFTVSASETITTGDILASQFQKYNVFDFSKIYFDFPDLFKDIRLPDLLIRKPVELANQMRVILSVLPETLRELDEERLNAAFDSMVKIASEYREELRKREDDLFGQKAMVLYRLDKLIHNCGRQKLMTLLARFRDRIREYSELRLLRKFAETHTGMEHESGVPKGGTFVLVYVDEQESAGPPVIQPFPGKFGIADILGSKPEDLLKRSPSPISTEDVRVLTRDFHTVTNTLKLGSGLKKELQDQIVRLENDFHRRIDDLVRRPPQPPVISRQVVVADFALPYLYKCECPEVNMMVISQITFSLSKTEFCKSDRSRYPFITDPVGGVVESDAGGVVAEGNEYFFEPANASPDGNDIRFTYIVNNQTAVFNIRLYQPDADFRFETRQDEDGSVTTRFINRSSGAERYEWDFGDGNQSSDSDPVHTWTDPETDRMTVTLTAFMSGCSDRISKRVEIPREIPVVFDIEPKKGFPERTYCTTDDRVYRFTAQPGMRLIEGSDLQGVKQTESGYVLDPSVYKPGSYTFRYLSKSLKVTILEGPSDQFSHEILRETEDLFMVRFTYEGRNAESVLWTIRGQNPVIGNTAEFTLLKREGLTRELTLRVTGSKGCIAQVVRQVTFQVKPPERERLNDLLHDLRRDIDLTRDVTLDTRLFDGASRVTEITTDVLDNLRRETESTEGIERFRTGELNDKIASDFREVLDSASKLVLDTSKQGTEEEKRTAANLFDTQASTLIRLVTEEEKDVNKTSEMGKLLTRMESSIKTMKEEGIDPDPDKRLELTLTRAVKEAAEQPKLQESLLRIGSTLKR
jgi:PKD repeat protein